MQKTVTNAIDVLQNPKMIHRTIKRAALLLMVGSPLMVGSAHAGLGGDAASVPMDAEQLQSVVHTTALQGYDIHQFSSDNGVSVREFVNRQGIVFAVAWNGPVVPDLQRLLGSYFADYVKALAALKPAALRRPLHIATPDWVIESGGHLRAYNGRAYLPALIPTGTPASDLR